MMKIRSINYKRSLSELKKTIWEKLIKLSTSKVISFESRLQIKFSSNIFNQRIIERIIC